MPMNIAQAIRNLGECRAAAYCAEQSVDNIEILIQQIKPRHEDRK